MTEPLFSIVIPTIERTEDLVRCVTAVLKSVEAARARHGDFELIVTDDSRTDDTKRRLEAFGNSCRWLAGPRHGPGQNRNRGAALARGTWIIFVDDDCIPAQQWFGAYMTAIETPPRFVVFEGKTVADRPRLRADEAAPINESGGYLWSCNFCIQRELFNSLGGFDERYRVHNEDKDLAARLRARSIEFPFVPSAVVVHPWRRRKLRKDGWKPASGYLTDTLLFLTLNPEENRKLPWHRVLRIALRYIEWDLKTAYQNLTAAGLMIGLAWSLQLMVQAMVIGWHQHFRFRPAEKPLVPLLAKRATRTATKL